MGLMFVSGAVMLSPWPEPMSMSPDMAVFLTVAADQGYDSRNVLVAANKLGHNLMQKPSSPP
jgi:hypothetical protein